MNDVIKEKLAKLPRNPGVYIYRDINGKVIYVGKAKSLKDRVGSYFQINLASGTKTSALVSKINDLEYILVESELEALILEAELIKKYKPKYNVIQKDDKSYLYIVIRSDVVILNDKKIKLPKIITARRTDLLPDDVTFGPYPDGTTAKYILKTARKLFPFRDCSDNKFKRHQTLKRPCLYGYIGVCTAPCVNMSESDLQVYKDNINSVKSLLVGNSSKVVTNLQKEMILSSKNQEFEKAAKYRDLLSKFKYVRQQFKSPDVYINNPYFVSDLANEALNQLTSIVPVLKQLPMRIECYDISNISGTEAVGSMVVATKGIIDKSQYRKFKIKMKNTPDDFEMMREVLTRRLKRTEWPVPDLIVVDGGKGQLSAGYDSMDAAGVFVSMVGLAKKEEIIVYKDHDDFVELKYPKDNEGLKLLIRLRDEAHRFAQSYHHQLRLKKIRS